MNRKKILSEISAETDPFKQFEKWYSERLKVKIPYPDSVTLGTSTPDGQVSVRTVLLKEYSADGFVFFTNYNSKKGIHLSLNPKAALLFYWPESGRQVRIEGFVKKLSGEESGNYFNTRPRESQLGAWASEQSTPIPDRAYLMNRYEFYVRKFEGQPVERPSHWGGYLLLPESVEFWQEGEFRLHDRLLYTRNNSSWHIERLAP